MHSVEIRAVQERQVFLEKGKQVEGRHRTPAEEGLSHPSIVFFKVVWRVFVAKDVDKEQAGRSEPSGDFGEKGRVGFHVFEHLDRENVRESASQCGS